MTSIFKDAAVELGSYCAPVTQQSTVSSKFHSSSHSKRSYFPLLTKRTKHDTPEKTVLSEQVLQSLANTGSESLQTEDLTLPNLRPGMGLSEDPLPRDSPTCVGPNDTAGKEPLSSGFTSPVGLHVYVGNPETTPVIAVYQDSDEDDCHSTHGVPYIIAPQEALHMPQQHTVNIDAWLNELMDPAMGACSLPPTKPSYIPAPSDTESGHDTSSPTPQIITKKMRGTSSIRTIRYPSQASTIAVQAPLFLNTVSRRPYYLDISRSSYLPKSTVRNSSNKENYAPPIVALSWNSVASSPPQKNCVDERHLQSSAAPAPRTVSQKVDAISHPHLLDTKYSLLTRSSQEAMADKHFAIQDVSDR
ncbi:hypothetical protein MMC15_004479 [Xylographa vitiligo]|nr:hypothetical protein [Xylographa vitiligo]